MASFTIRNIPEDTKHRVRQLAAASGSSMEEYLRRLILSVADAPGSDTARVRERSTPFEHQPVPAKEASRTRIERLIALGKGLDFEPPEREHEEVRDIDFS